MADGNSKVKVDCDSTATTVLVSGAGEEEVPDEEYLLKMLEEQNRLLEQDARYTQKIKRTESNASSITMESVVQTMPTSPSPRQLQPPPSQQQPPTSPHPPPPQQQQQLHQQHQPLTTTPEQETPSTVTDSITSAAATIVIDNESNEEELLSMWASILKNWEESVKKNGKLIKQLVRRGIPDPLRGMAWQLLSGPHNESLKKMYPSLITEEACPFEKQIKRDLDRTFPDHSFFKDRDGFGQESLLSVMKAYSLYDREVGYCQGSLFLAGELLIHMPEEETFSVFVQLMSKYKLRELYKPSMTKLSICFYQLENLVEELFPKLNIHFKALGFYTSMYSSSWFLTLFTSTLPLSICFRIMDIFLDEGLEIIFRIGLALMEHSHDELMKMDLEEMTKLFQKGIKTIHEAAPEALFDRAFKIKVTSKKLKKLEKEYLLKKEKQATENSNLILLKEENENLEKRVMALEMECAALADRLIQGQVTRAQEAEELFITRREVSRLRKELKALKEEQFKPKEQDRSLLTPNHPEMKEKDRTLSAPSLRNDLLAMSPTASPIGSNPNTQHVSREEAQQCLRELGISPTTTPTTKPPTPDSTLQPLELEMVLQELATTKIRHAETLHLLELKSLELKGVRNELHQAKEQVKSLQQSREETDSHFVCHRCGQALDPSNASLNSSKTGEDEEDEPSSNSSCSLQNGSTENAKCTTTISHQYTTSTVNGAGEAVTKAPPIATPSPETLNNSVANSIADDT